ncbi:MAG: hydroxymethylbilane synthase, partial [Pseudomonadota bacterium]
MSLLNSSTKREYLIGTRGSLLALTQTQMIKKELEKLGQDQFKIVPIMTEGDTQTNAPLWQLPGQNFFTKELDQALLEKKVDFVIHSYKDLGLLRPTGITLAAVTKRHFANDILLLKNETMELLRHRQLPELSVATSSPRRSVNLSQHLKDLLPFGEHLQIQLCPLRGNVNTRLRKLQEGECQSIVLALAGLERLAQDEQASREIQGLCQNLSFMILPPSLFPPAAAQGALAIECLAERDDNNELYTKLQKLNCPQTFLEIQRERQAFGEYGGGCHLSVGIHVHKVGDFFVHCHRGQVDKKNEKVEVRRIFMENAPRFLLPPAPFKIFVGLPPRPSPQKEGPQPNTAITIYDELIERRPLAANPTPYIPAHFFVSSAHCLNLFKNIFHQGTVWAAGTQTMRKLAKEGFWVMGCGDSLGEKEIKHLYSSEAVRMLLGENYPLPWRVLGHEESISLELG